jgi:glutaredoxin-like protein NrdH
MLQDLQTTYDDPVIVYSTPNCSQCKMTYKTLERVGIAYTVVDLSEDLDTLARFRQEGYLQAPIVKAGRDTWSGFRPDLIKELAA